MKFFTIEEAEGCLPAVEKLVKKASRLRNKIVWLLDSNDALAEVNTESGFHFFVTEYVDVNKEFHRLYFQFYKAISALHELGVIVKDVEEGLVDFPFRLNGRDVFLCWQLGEDKIQFWHDCDCYSEWRPIVDLDDFLKVEKDL